MIRSAPWPEHGTLQLAGQRAAPLSGVWLCHVPERGWASAGDPKWPGAVCGLRSGAAIREDAELVPLWVGKHDPALIACLADVGVPGT